MCDRWFNGDVKGAAALQMEMLPLINALFCEVNPIPVKAGMAAMGWCENFMRLPLTPMSEEKWPRLEKAMRDQGLI
jgi:4-hydroxy-tetrahydrodipicolinate synthase